MTYEQRLLKAMTELPTPLQAAGSSNHTPRADHEVNGVMNDAAVHAASKRELFESIVLLMGCFVSSPILESCLLNPVYNPDNDAYTYSPNPAQSIHKMRATVDTHGRVKQPLYSDPLFSARAKNLWRLDETLPLQSSPMVQSALRTAAKPIAVDSLDSTRIIADDLLKLSGQQRIDLKKIRTSLQSRVKGLAVVTSKAETGCSGNSWRSESTSSASSLRQSSKSRGFALGTVNTPDQYEVSMVKELMATACQAEGDAQASVIELCSLFISKALEVNVLQTVASVTDNRLADDTTELPTINKPTRKDYAVEDSSAYPIIEDDPSFSLMTLGENMGEEELCQDANHAMAEDSSAEPDSEMSTLPATPPAGQTMDTKFQEMANILPEIVWTGDEAGRLDFINDRWYELPGFDKEKAFTQGWVSLVADEDRQRCDNLWDCAIVQGKPFKLEFRIEGKGKESPSRWYLGSGIPLKDEAGKITRWIGTCTDIHDLKEAQQTLIQSQERTNAIVANCSATIWAVNTEGFFTFYSGRNAFLLGVDPSDRLGKSYYEVNESRPDAIDALRRALAGEAAQLESQFHERYFHTHMSPSYDEHMQINGVIGVYIDITDRKKQELDLKKWEEFFRSSQCGMMISQSYTTIMEVNEAFAAMHGTTADEWKGRNVLDMYSGDSKSSFDELVTRLESTGHITYESEHLRKDGTTFPVLADATAVKDENGHTIYSITSFIDLTETKRAAQERTALIAKEQAAVQASRLKSSFLATMSHEIRTPINGIIGMIDLVSDGSLVGEEREHLKAAKQSTEALLNLVSNILDLSKIEAGKLELECSEFDAFQFVEEIVHGGLWYTARQKGVTLEGKFGDLSGWLLYGDSLRLRQVLTNLVSNAIKFTPTGGCVVLAVNFDENTMTAKFAVQDSGIGISEESLAAVFDPFSQAEVSTTRRFGGSGLGLSISRQLVELMNGQIGAESEVGVGSVFWLQVPFSSGRHVAGCSAVNPSYLPKTPTDEASVQYASRSPSSQATRTKDNTRSNASAGSFSDGDSSTGERNSAENTRANPELRVRKKGKTSHDMHHKITQVATRSSASKRRQVGQHSKLSSLRRDISNSVSSPTQSEADADVESDVEDVEIGEAFLPENYHLLVVDDNHINRVVTTKILERLGYRVCTAADGREAISSAEKQRFDLILMDCHMPEMDGYEATKYLREQSLNVHVKKMPIIAITANALKGEREKCLVSGMNDYISKPVSRDRLAEVVQTWIVKTTTTEE